MKNTHVNNQQINSWYNDLKEILYQPKKYVSADKNVQQTRKFCTTDLNPVEEENPYVWFVYGQQIIFYHT